MIPEGFDTEIVPGVLIETNDGAGKWMIAAPENPGHWGRVVLVVEKTVYFRSHVDGRLKREPLRNCYRVSNLEDFEQRRDEIKAAWDDQTRFMRRRDATRHFWNLASARRARYCPDCDRYVVPIEQTRGERNRGEAPVCPECLASTRPISKRTIEAIHKHQDAISEAQLVAAAEAAHYTIPWCGGVDE